MSLDNSSQPSGELLPRNVKVLGLASLLNDVASEMIFPLLPQFLLKVLGGSLFWLGIIEGAVDTTASVVKLFAGGWSDRAGSRKAFVVFGYGLAAVVRPLISVIVAPWQLLLIRTADRFGKGIRTSPRDAMIAECTPPHLRGRAFGFNRGMDHLGAAVGPLLAAAFLWFYPDQFRALFLLTVLPGLLVVALVVFGLREARALQPADPKLDWKFKPPSGTFRLYLCALVVFTLGNSSDAFLLVRAGELGISAPLLPIVWCGFHVGKSGGNLLAGRVVDKIGPRPMILLGWLFYAGIYLAFALATTAWQAWVLFLAYAVFFALTEPAERTLVANLVGAQERGLAYGWFNAAVGIATLPASLVFGGLYQWCGALVAFGWGAALALLAALMLAVMPRGRPPHDTTALGFRI
jgi:MFS family permease